MEIKSATFSPLTGLRRLKHVDAESNNVTTLPPAILDLKPELEVGDYTGEGKIYLKGNPLENPPPEIIRRGKEAMRAYFRQLEEEEARPVNEVKALFVGDGGAGKTCLIKRLLEQGYNPEENQTDGIDIHHWPVKTGGREITVNAWDFGGQEIMHATHQFFLSKRSLYVLVLDGRRDEKTEYWLKHIESFGGDSPVLVVLNKIDQNPGHDLNRPFLLQKYQRLLPPLLR